MVAGVAVEVVVVAAAVAVVAVAGEGEGCCGGQQLVVVPVFDRGLGFGAAFARLRPVSVDRSPEC